MSPFRITAEANLTISHAIAAGIGTGAKPTPPIARRLSLAPVDDVNHTADMDRRASPSAEAVALTMAAPPPGSSAEAPPGGAGEWTDEQCAFLLAFGPSLLGKGKFNKRFKKKLGVRKLRAMLAMITSDSKRVAELRAKALDCPWCSPAIETEHRKMENTKVLERGKRKKEKDAAASNAMEAAIRNTGGDSDPVEEAKRAKRATAKERLRVGRRNYRTLAALDPLPSR